MLQWGHGDKCRGRVERTLEYGGTDFMLQWGHGDKCSGRAPNNRSGCQTWFLVSGSIRAMICWSSSAGWGGARIRHHVIDGPSNWMRSRLDSPVELTEARD